MDSSLSSTETQSEQRIELPCSKRRKWDSFDASELERQNFMVEDVSDQPVSCSQTMEESQITHQAQRADGPQQPGVAGESSVKSIQACWILEVFAGTASMVSAAAAAGMKRSVGLDHIRIAHRKGKVIQLDLLLDSHQSLLWKWLDSPGLAAVWIAPPCGKASRGLGLVEPGQTGTSPLNSPEHPEGKPDLAPRDAERVAKANLLYVLTARIWKACQERKIPVVIENPYRSPFWHVPQMTSLLEQEDAVLVRSDLCMFGGQRPQSIALLSNSSLVQSLAAQCDGKHEHLAWGKVQGDSVTKHELAYPTLFCKTFLLALTARLKDSGWVDEREVQDLKGPGPAASKVLTTQARAKRAASFRVIPEFRKTVRCSLTEEERSRLVAPGWTPASKFKDLDTGAAEEVKLVPVPGSPTDVWMHIPWTPQEFVTQARRAGHPAHLHLGIPPQMKHAIDKNASMTPLQIMKIRTAQSQRWITRAAELEKAEAAFKQSLPPHIRASLKNKRILLFKEMLEAAHYPDKAVADDMASGFNLVGHLELPAGWAPDFRPASISASDLAALSRDGNQQIIRDVASSSSFTEELWQKSMEEVSKGWSEGPFSFDELPEGAIISKRFAIQQGKKIRPIDDLSQSFLNAAFGSEGKIHPSQLGAVPFRTDLLVAPLVGVLR